MFWCAIKHKQTNTLFFYSQQNPSLQYHWKTLICIVHRILQLVIHNAQIYVTLMLCIHNRAKLNIVFYLQSASIKLHQILSYFLLSVATSCNTFFTIYQSLPIFCYNSCLLHNKSAEITYKRRASKSITFTEENQCSIICNQTLFLQIIAIIILKYRKIYIYISVSLSV